jgi:hypothetical protein
MSTRIPARGILIALTSMIFVACMPVPLLRGDEDYSRNNIGDKVPEFVVPGKTTRADVLLSLGEPDGASENGIQFTYTRVTSNGGLGFAISTSTLYRAEGMTYRRLIILFDETGIVTSAKHEQVSCSERDLTPDSRLGLTPTPGSRRQNLVSTCLNVSGQDALLKNSADSFLGNENIDGRIFAPAVWHQGTPSFSEVKEHRWFFGDTPGSLVVGDGSILFFSSNADRKSEPLLKLAYVEIGDVYVETFIFGSYPRLVVKDVSGHYASFWITSSFSTDSKLTERAAELVKSRWRAATAK